MSAGPSGLHSRRERDAPHCGANDETRMSNIEGIPTQQTVEFIRSQVRPGGHILEVGCGDGEVAGALLHRGFDVTAIDADPERVAKAQKRGVRAVTASWPDFDITAVDAIVFTRSLHHMSRLADSIEAAGSVLAPNGLLLVDDFAVESATEETLNWFRNLIGTEPFRSVAKPHPDSFVEQLLASDSPMETFREHHTAHEVHPFDLMHRLIRERFPNCSVQSVPYLYRYFASAAVNADNSEELVDEFLRRETEASKKQQISLIGRRIVSHFR